MSHTIRDKQKLKARASKIQGQVVALKKMLDDNGIDIQKKIAEWRKK